MEAAKPRGTVFHHNTSLERIPYLDEAAIDAIFTPAADHAAAQKWLSILR